jgi:hypothetical protein
MSMMYFIFFYTKFKFDSNITEFWNKKYEKGQEKVKSSQKNLTAPCFHEKDRLKNKWWQFGWISKGRIIFQRNT